MAKPKIEIPEDLSAPYAVPEGVTSQADIDAIMAEAHSRAEALLANDEASAEDVAKAEWLIQAKGTLAGKGQELAQAEQERKERIAATREQLNPKAKAEAEAEDDDAKDETDEHRDGDEPEGGEGGNGNGDGVGQLDTPAEPVLVASKGAARRRSAIRDAAKGGGSGKGAIPEGKPREAWLTAAAEVPGFNAGAKIDFDKLGVAAAARFGQLPSGQFGRSSRTVLPFGQAHMPSDEALVASKMVAGNNGRAYDLDAAIEWAVSGKRLKQETGEDTLLAAGGWCAPSETLYDLVDLSTDDGLIDLPGITVNRGGVRYSLGPEFSTVYGDGANFTRTEAQTIAGTAKPVVNIPCPTFADHRMVVDGLYLTGDILSQKGYPEAYTDFTTKSLKAFAHYVNAQSIADMVALSTAVDLTAAGVLPNPSATTELLGAVELQIIDMRYRQRLGINQAVELKLPLWLKGVIRSDYAKRATIDNPAEVTDAMLDNFFALRGANAQWVYDWQDALTDGTGLGFGGAAAPTAWPTEVSFLLYPQGTFVRALSDVIELNAVYDSEVLKTNQYVALFMEQARLVLQRTPDARVVTVPLKVTGAVGAAFDYTAAGAQPTV